MENNRNVDIREIIYVPTLRCNYNCAFCGQQHVHAPEQEMPALQVYEKIKASKLLSKYRIQITGGEPFLKSDLSDFVANFLNFPGNMIYVDIITNGFFTEQIEKLIKKIKVTDKLSFGVSIDGIGDTHNSLRGNKHAFEHAVRTLELINSYNIQVTCGTVMQPKNLNELEELNRVIADIGNGKVGRAFSPLILDISPEEKFPFDEEQIKAMWHFLPNAKDKKYLLSQGDLFIKDCHAGLRNLVVGPTGEVYACYTGFAYNYIGDDSAAYKIGDLRIQELDDILLSDLRKKVYSETVKQCEGCQDRCETNREELYFNMSYDMSDEEIEKVKCMDIEEYFTDYAWNVPEKNGENIQIWTRQTRARLFVKNKMGDLKLCFSSGYPKDDLFISIYCQGNKVLKKQVAVGEFQIILQEEELGKKKWIEIVIESSLLWSPSVEFDNMDTRMLGICLTDLQWIYTMNVALDIERLKVRLTPSCMYLDRSTQEEIKIKVENVSEKEQVFSSEGKYPVMVSYHIFDKGGKEIIHDGLRTRLPKALKGGDTSSLVMNYDFHALNAGVEYYMVITLVQEGVGWFDDYDAENSARIYIR